MNSRWYFKREHGTVYLVVEELAHPYRGYRLHVLAPGERFTPFLRNVMLAHVKVLRESITNLDTFVEAGRTVRTYDPIEARTPDKLWTGSKRPGGAFDPVVVHPPMQHDTRAGSDIDRQGWGDGES